MTTEDVRRDFVCFDREVHVFPQRLSICYVGTAVLLLLVLSLSISFVPLEEGVLNRKGRTCTENKLRVYGKGQLYMRLECFACLECFSVSLIGQFALKEAVTKRIIGRWKRCRVRFA